MVAQRLRDYEMMMILTPEATEEEVTSSVDRISKFIEDQGGSVTSQETIGQRRLAYSINKFMEGIYVLVYLSLDAKEVIALDRNLLGSDDVLRHLIMKK